MFVDRTNGVITGAFNVAQHDGQEELPDDAAELVAFSSRITEPSSYNVSRLRLKLELASRGLLGSVEAAVKAGGAVPQMYWADATTFESNHPLVAQIGAAIGLTGEQIKALFKAASERDA